MKDKPDKHSQERLAAIKNDAKEVPASSEPTPYELARLAVAIHQQSSQFYSDETLVTEALAIWLTARKMLETWRTNPASVFPESARQPPPEPRPRRYPVSLDEFLGFMLPRYLSERTGERYGLFREYLAFRLRNPTPPDQTFDWEHSALYAKTAPTFDCCKPRIVPALDFPCSYSLEKGHLAKPTEPTKDDVDRYFALWRANPIPDERSFEYHKRWFGGWFQTKHAAESSTAKAKSALRRHAKEKLRKHLWEVSCKANPKIKVPLKDSPEITSEQMSRLDRKNEGKPLKDYKNWDYNIDDAAK